MSKYLDLDGLEYYTDKIKEEIENTIDNKELVPVSGTNDGTNWSTLTINGTTKNIPVGGGGSSGIFVCEYGETTFSEIGEALSNNLLPVAVYSISSNSTYYYIYAGKDQDYSGGQYYDRYCFVSNRSSIVPQYLWCTNNNDVWSSGSSSLQTTYAMESTLTPTSTSSYPSSKATADFVNNTLNSRLNNLTLSKLTQAEYNALSTKDANTMYIIVG